MARVAPSERFRAELDEALVGVGQEQDPVETIGRLGARLILQQALEDEVTVLLATYEAEDLRHYASQGLLLAEATGPVPTAPTVYFVTITIAALVVQVIGSVLPAWSLRGVSVLEDELGVVQVWPTSPSVEFAQRQVLRHEDMIRFTKLLYNVVARLGGGAPPAR